MPNIITSIIAPVNESIWEHLKILFTGILISGVIQKIIVIKNKLDISNVCISNFIGAFLSMPIFLIIYVPIYNAIGKKFGLTIFVMFLVIVIAELISYYIMNKKDLYLENYAILFTVMVYIVFLILTYYPLNNGIFIDPISNKSGINIDKY
ncbi:MAG: hypothetical protein IJI49_03500 [Bacilli bacterium]|nr:hypothetical protein [Bacilli bacterium]